MAADEIDSVDGGSPFDPDDMVKQIPIITKDMVAQSAGRGLDNKDAEFASVESLDLMLSENDSDADVEADEQSEQNEWTDDREDSVQARQEVQRRAEEEYEEYLAFQEELERDAFDMLGLKQFTYNNATDCVRDKKREDPEIYRMYRTRDAEGNRLEKPYLDNAAERPMTDERWMANLTTQNIDDAYECKRQAVRKKYNYSNPRRRELLTRLKNARQLARLRLDSEKAAQSLDEKVVIAEHTLAYAQDRRALRLAGGPDWKLPKKPGEAGFNKVFAEYISSLPADDRVLCDCAGRIVHSTWPGLANLTPPGCGGSRVAHAYQRILAKTMSRPSPTHRMLVNWGTGTGKTQAMIGVLNEYYNIPKAKAVMVPETNIKDNFVTDLLTGPDNCYQRIFKVSMMTLDEAKQQYEEAETQCQSARDEHTALTGTVPGDLAGGFNPKTRPHGDRDAATQSLTEAEATLREAKATLQEVKKIQAKTKGEGVKIQALKKNYKQYKEDKQKVEADYAGEKKRIEESTMEDKENALEAAATRCEQELEKLKPRLSRIFEQFMVQDKYFELPAPLYILTYEEAGTPYSKIHKKTLMNWTPPGQRSSKCQRTTTSTANRSMGDSTTPSSCATRPIT